MSRRPVGDPCPGWLTRLAQGLSARGRPPSPAELGVTAEELARCLERAGQALAGAQAPPELPFGASASDAAPARDPAPASAKDPAPPPDPGSRTHILHADGGSRGNPGPAGAGAALLDSGGGQVALLKRYLGVATNNVAEYQGLIMGLEEALARGVKSLEVRLDSELLVRQLNGQYKVKAAHLLPLYQEAKSLLARFSKARLVHIPRAQNALADELANQAMDER